MSKGKRKDVEKMTVRQALPRCQEWKRMDTISMSNHGRRLLKDVLEGNLDTATILKKIALAMETFSQIQIMWLDTEKENKGDE
jgi:hypothetical protein